MSTRYARSPTTIAVAGPERSGTGRGVPVPSITIFVGGGSAATSVSDTRMTAAKNAVYRKLRMGRLSKVSSLNVGTDGLPGAQFEITLILPPANTPQTRVVAPCDCAKHDVYRSARRNRPPST